MVPTMVGRLVEANLEMALGLGLDAATGSLTGQPKIPGRSKPALMFGHVW